MAKILVVDDSKVMREMITASLQNEQHEIFTAEDGEEALELAQHTAVDLVLSDVNMPNMTGMALVSQLRLLPSYAEVPIIMLTTESSDAKKNKAKIVGATGWLTKPIDPMRLVKTVNSILAKLGHTITTGH